MGTIQKLSTEKERLEVHKLEPLVIFRYAYVKMHIVSVTYES